MLKIGIVGLPNVGKSTLFNALTKSKQANAQNFPFCTIEPNVGVVNVPDERLEKLAKISKSQKIIPTAIEFVDIAGLVAGASKGEGLGNKFLSHIREVDAIVQVVRSFTDTEVIHVDNRVNPNDDADIVNLELILADSQSVEKQLTKIKKDAKGDSLKEAQKKIDLLEKILTNLLANRLANTLDYTLDELIILKELHLLTMKPMLYVVNVDESMQEKIVFDRSSNTIRVCAKMEAELADLSDTEAKEYLQVAGLEESGLDKLIRTGYKMLNLVTYLTSGEPETRAWTVKQGAKAPEAAGVIHTDFIKGFIKVDVVNWADFVEYGGWNKIKETGKMRLEGKDYEIRDGDVVYFHIK